MVMAAQRCCSVRVTQTDAPALGNQLPHAQAEHPPLVGKPGGGSCRSTRSGDQWERGWRALASATAWVRLATPSRRKMLLV